MFNLLKNNPYVIAATLAGVGYLVFRNDLKQAVADVANSINPLNDNNVFATSANSVVEKVTGEEGASIGSFVYDATHKEDGTTSFIGDILDKALGVS